MLVDLFMYYICVDSAKLNLMEEKNPDFRKKKNTKIIKIYKSFTNVMYTLYSNNTNFVKFWME